MSDTLATIVRPAACASARCDPAPATPDTLHGIRPGAVLPPADPGLLATWRARLADDAGRGMAPVLRVGLVWACPHRWDHGRSIRLAMLTPLLEADPAVAFYSLQSGPSAREVLALRETIRPIDHAADLYGIEDTVALVSLLDLVVTVDVAVGRLADALGRPVWLPSPRGRPPGEAGSFRSGGARVFAQPRPSDWRPPIARMAAELAAFALSRTLPAAPSEAPDAFRPGPDWFSGR